MKSGLFRQSIPSIVAGFVLAAASGLGLYFVPGGWLSVWQGVAWIFGKSMAYLAAPAQVPTALLVFMGLSTIAAFVIAAVVFYASRSTAPAFTPPRETTVFGIVWRWSDSDYGRFDRLASFCPKCDYQIYPRDAAPFHAVHQTSYFCENCQWRSEVFEAAPEQIEDRVRRELQRLAREEFRKIKSK